jgi:hypothetical protein
VIWASGIPVLVAVTATAVFCIAVVDPFPSWPLPPAPQQYAAPALPSAHVEVPPVVIRTRVTPDSTPLAVTATAVLLVVLALFPSWPLVPSPQQYAAPVLASAHV